MKHLTATVVKAAFAVGALFLAVVAGRTLISPGRTANAASEGTLVQTAGLPGLVALDEASGSVTFCPAAVNASGAPYGKCAGIGGLPTTSLTGNGFVSIGNTAAFVGNLATGYVVECSLTWDANSGQPIGSCVPVANPIK